MSSQPPPPKKRKVEQAEKARKIINPDQIRLALQNHSPNNPNAVIEGASIIKAFCFSKTD
jgi:hypothetical protein